jgi:hypothetical protein
MPTLPVLTVRVSERVMGDLEERAYPGNPRGEVVRRDIYRYRMLVRQAAARLKAEKIFSGDEQALVIDALNGVIIDEYVQAVVGNVEDAIALDGLDGKWEVERAAIIEKVHSLTPLEQVAVVEAAERFWAATARGEDRDVRGGLFGDQK